MGLDIYAYRISKDTIKENNINVNDIDQVCNALKGREEDLYFRKVNFLYKYFEDSLENELCLCTKTEIKDIIDRCTEVLNKNNEATSKELLPTTNGFCFGSTKYDKWYYYDVNIVKESLENIYQHLDDEDYIFWEFWW
jgi:hypothetical protein